MSFTWKRPEGRLNTPEQMMRVIIRVADELDMPDKRAACIICGMTMRQEGDFWIPGNNADPAFAANPAAFPHDSMGDDGRSVGPLQQQTSGPPPATQWGWGGLYGDPEGTRKRMDPYESVKLFMAALKKRPYRAGNATEAGDWAQDVQKSGVPDAYDDDWGFVNDLYNRVAGTATPPPPPAREPYGMPRGTNSDGYGNNGARFPDWVYALGNAFGLLPSTYPGHQESNRTSEGYDPNPQLLNRGIDWSAPGTVDEADRMQRFADYIFSIRGEVEQLIWENPRTGKRLGVAVGKDVTNTPYYDYDGGYNAHRNHVHTRQSHSIPLPGGFVPQPVPVPHPIQLPPAFQELTMFNGRNNSSPRSRPAMNFFLHTEEGNSNAEQLARFCQGQNNVSYHYTLRDGILYDVVDTDYYSWSVLEANVFSINLCFAGSRAAMSREEWLKREHDIEIAAYIAVQDCKKYGMSTEVLVPDWNKQGKDVYAGVPRSGISDHNYVTRELGIGSHTDVGRNFPWDVFVRYVNKYATTAVLPGDEMSQADVARLEGKIDRILLEQTQTHPSRSQVRKVGEGKIDTWAGMDLNDDGNMDLVATFLRALVKYPDALDRLTEVSRNTDPARGKDALLAQALLSTVGKLQRLIDAGPQTVTAIAAPAGVAAAAPLAPNAAEIARAVAAILPPVPNVDALLAENARLRDELKQERQGIPGPTGTLLTGELNVVKPPSTTAEKVSGVVDAVEGFTQHAKGMDPTEVAALDVAVGVIKETNKEQTK